MLWNISVDGEAVSSGVVENLNIAPRKTETVDLGFKTIPQADADIFLNVSYVLKTADGVLPAGTEVAYDQIMLREKSGAAFVAGSASVSGKSLAHSETADAYVFSGSFAFAGTQADRVGDWTATFDKTTGFLTGYTVNGVQMLSEPLTPEFARAPNENDMGAMTIREMYNTWRYPVYKLKAGSLVVDKATDGVGLMALSAEYEPIAGGAATVRMFYEIFPDGSIKATETMKEAGGLAKAPALMRFTRNEVRDAGPFHHRGFLRQGPLGELLRQELRRRCRPLCAECQRPVPLRLCPHSGVRHEDRPEIFPSP